MIKFKACGRCGGDVHFNPDRHGVEVYCLQCGVRRRFTSEDMRALATAAPAAAHSAYPDQRAA